jgi:hypothetical protein
MTKKIGAKASIPNPALKSLAALIGEWKTTGSHPYFPDTVLHGRASFAWLDDGAFLIMRSEIDDPHFPDGIEIFGSDDVAKKFFMLHFDERGVSRKFDVSISGNQISWWRDEPTFSQRYVLSIEDNGNKLVSKGEMSQAGAPWEKDLALIYTRIT